MDDYKNREQDSDKIGFYAQARTYVDLWRDTYAYALLVIELSMPSPDYDLIKNKVIPTLENVVANQEDELSKKPRIDRADL